MQKILSDGTWYRAVSPRAMYESDYEAILVELSDKLFQNYHTIVFKEVVSNGYGNAQADLALIDYHYRSWYVVEVEMADHSLMSHVVPQVYTLASAHYTPDIARRIAAKNPTLSPNRLFDLMKGEQPQVQVVVNGPAVGWETQLARYGATLMVVQVFRDDRQRLILLVDGEGPRSPEPSEILSYCIVDPDLPYLLRLESPGGLNIGHGTSIQVTFAGGTTLWKRVDVSNRAWLQPVNQPNPLISRVRYRLIRSGNGLEFVPDR